MLKRLLCCFPSSGKHRNYKTNDQKKALSQNPNVLNTNNATQGLRLSGGGSYTLTDRTIFLNAVSNAIDVVGGTTATLDTAFGLSAATNNLQKNDNGTLVINADNTGWTGTLTVNAGAVQLANDLALGTGASIAVGAAGFSGARARLEDGCRGACRKWRGETGRAPSRWWTLGKTP